MSETSSLIIGGAIGFVSAVLSPIIVEPLRHFIFGPKLMLDFDPNNKGCKSQTRENVMVKVPDSDEHILHSQIDAYYIRVKVRNDGRQIAKECRAYLIDVEKYNAETNKYDKTIYCDSIPLAWSASGSSSDAFGEKDLPKNVNQFIDVVSTRENTNQFKVEVVTSLLRYEELFTSQGKFRFTILVSGENVKPVTKKIMFEWNGQWDQFAIEAA